MTIDWWTLGLEAINVAVLVWLLGRFFWAPVVGIIEKRRAAIAEALAKADARDRELEKAAADIAGSRAGFAAERDAIIAGARKEAEIERAAIIEKARKDAAELEAKAHQAVEAERETERKAWTARSARLAVTIAGRLAARLDGPAVDAAFLGWLVKAAGDLSGTAKASLASHGMKLVAVTARPLDDAERKRVRSEIAGAIGSRPAMTFETDPSLIAGMELHGSHFSLRNSWRADLDRILEEISDER